MRFRRAEKSNAARAAATGITVSDVRVAMMTREYPPEVYGGAGVHVTELVAQLPPALLETSRLFADWTKQSVEIGEFQHAGRGAGEGASRITAIGDVLRGYAPGRTSDGEITIFDSSGLALQDLYVAAAVLEARLVADG